MRAAKGPTRCQGVNKAGKPCGGYKARGTDFCMLHGDALSRPPERGDLPDSPAFVRSVGRRWKGEGMAQQTPPPQPMPPWLMGYLIRYGADYPLADGVDYGEH